MLDVNPVPFLFGHPDASTGIPSDFIAAFNPHSALKP